MERNKREYNLERYLSSGTISVNEDAIPLLGAKEALFHAWMCKVRDFFLITEREQFVAFTYAVRKIGKHLAMSNQEVIKSSQRLETLGLLKRKKIRGSWSYRVFPISFLFIDLN